MAGKLEGQVAFITGAARGQGRSHAVALAKEGADIIAIDVTKQVETVPYNTATAEDMKETVRLVEEQDRRIIAGDVDVRDLKAMTQFVDSAVADLGRLDIVLANAGISTMAPTIEMDEEQWQTMIDINLTGVWKTIRAAVPHIVAGKRGGSVVMTSSTAALMTLENIAHYSAAKAGLVQMMRVLAKELAPQSIRVNTVHPTTLASDMVLNEPTYRLFRPDLENPTREDFETAARAMNKMPVALIDPIDITNAILFLVTDTGRYVTGSKIVVDAGGTL